MLISATAEESPVGVWYADYQGVVVGDCFINTCCEWAKRENDDLCGLDSHRITSGEKARLLVERSVLKAAFEGVGL